MLPPEDEFPYTVRINSEVMASDGSTSMASVCGGTLLPATVAISNLSMYIFPSKLVSYISSVIHNHHNF